MGRKTVRITKFQKIKKKKSFICVLILRFNQSCPFGRNGSKRSLPGGIYLPEEQLLIDN